jgi:hypothetical protein
MVGKQKHVRVVTDMLAADHGRPVKDVEEDPGERNGDVSDEVAADVPDDVGEPAGSAPGLGRDTAAVLLESKKISHSPLRG